MKPDDVTRIHHMVEAGESALQFVSGRQRADLDSDTMLMFALVRAIEIIGEAASRVSPESRAASPSTPWAAMITMRNRLIHAYFDINRDFVWQTATAEIPAVLPLLRALLPNN